jgi:hypothetical protein
VHEDHPHIKHYVRPEVRGNDTHGAEYDTIRLPVCVGAVRPAVDRLCLGFCLALAVCVGACGTARTTSATRAATPAPPTSSAADAACNSTPGDHSKTPSRVVTDSRGAKFTYFQEDTGGESYQVMPPPGFDPLTASDADLQTYLYPPRPNPTDVEAMANWKKVVMTQRSEPYECATSAEEAAK